MKFLTPLVLILVTGTLSIMAVDYFADGCIVDYDHLYERQVRPGVWMSYHGSLCHQWIIHTSRGRAEEGDHP